MRVVISGASGFVGSALSRHLESLGHTVAPLVRRAPQPGQIYWNILQGEVDTEALEGADAVVHLAGESIAGARWTAEKRRRIMDSRVQGTRLLAGAIAGLDHKPKVMVSASAIGFYGNGGDAIQTEDSPPGDNFLAEICQAWEAETRVAHDAGVRVVNFRVGIVLAPHGGALKEMLPVFRMGGGGPLGGGQQWISWITLDDIVRAITYCIETETLSGPVLGVAPHPARQRDFAKSLGRALNRPAFVPAPAFGIRLTMGEMGQQLLLEGQRCHPEQLKQSGFVWNHPELDAALAAVLMG